MRILETCPHCGGYYGVLGCLHSHDCPDYHDGSNPRPVPTATEAFKLDVKDGSWTGTFQEWQARGKPKPEPRMSDRDWAARSAGERDGYGEH